MGFLSYLLPKSDTITFLFTLLGQMGELAETTSLLRMRSRKITESSNLSLSATFHLSLFYILIYIITFVVNILL